MADLVRDIEAHCKHTNGSRNREQMDHRERGRECRDGNRGQQQSPRDVSDNHDWSAPPPVSDDTGEQTEEQDRETSGRRQNAHFQRCCPKQKNCRHGQTFARNP